MRIEKDPDMTKLAQEARRLSMGQTPPDNDRPGVGRRTSNTPPSTAAAPSVHRNGSGPRRPSEGIGGNRSPRMDGGERRQSNGYSNPTHSSTQHNREAIQKRTYQLENLFRYLMVDFLGCIWTLSDAYGTV